MQVISVLRLRADPNAVIRSRTGLIWHAAPAGRLVSTRSPEMRFASRQSANTNLPAAGTRERSAPAILNTNVLHYAPRKACLSWTPAALNLQERHFHVLAELSKTCLHWHRSLSLFCDESVFSQGTRQEIPASRGVTCLEFDADLYLTGRSGSFGVYQQLSACPGELKCWGIRQWSPV